MKLVNKTGYLKGAKTAKNPVNIIPSSLITTQGMAFPIKANGKTLYPNTGQYKFPSSPVIETPLKKKNQLDTSNIGPTIDKANLLKSKTNNNSPKLGNAFFAKPKPFTWKPPKNVAEFEKNKRIDSNKAASNRFRKKDTLEDNIAELLDITGASSWDDIQRNIEKEGFTPETYLEIAGAIPLLGRIPKLIKGKKLISQIARTAIKGTEMLEKGSNAPELYESYQDGTNELVPNKMSKTSLSKAQEVAYQRWMKSKGYNESDDYDMRGYWKKQGFKNLGSPKGGEHFTDEFKRLAPFSEGDNYPTLSDESNKASKFDKRGQGTWVGEGDNAKYVNYQKGTNKLIGKLEAIKKVYNKVEPYVSKTYDKGFNFLKENIPFVDKFLPSKKPVLKKPKPSNTFKRTGSETNEQLARFIANKVDVPQSVNKADLESLIKKQLDRVDGEEYVSRRMATTKETKEEIASTVKTWKDNLADKTNYNTYSDIKTPGEYTKWKNKDYVNVSGDVFDKEPDKFLDVFEHEFLHGLSPTLKQEKLYRNYPKLNVTPERTIKQKTKDLFSGKQKKLNYFNDVSEQQVRAVRMNDKIKKDLQIDNQNKLSKDNLDKWFDEHYNTNSETLDKTGFVDVTNLLDYNAAAQKSRGVLAPNGRPEVLDWLNKAWMIPAVGATGTAAVNSTTQEKKNGVKTLKYKKGSKGVSLAFSRGEKDPKGGLTQKGVDKYNRATGGNLKMAVTTPPSKLKAGSKAANRRKSFCSRMKGMKSKLTSAKTANDPNSRINKSLRKWNC